MKKNLAAEALLVLSGVAVLLTLGTWQVQRLQWKEELLAKIAAHAHQPPRVMAEIRTTVAAEDAVVEDGGDMDFHHVLLAGVFPEPTPALPSALRLAPRVLNGRVGAHLLTPFRLESGQIVIVNWGWVPENFDFQGFSAPAGFRTLTGILKRPEAKNRFTPDNTPEKGQWYWADLPAMAAALGHGEAEVAPYLFYKDAETGTGTGADTNTNTGAKDSEKFPVGGQAPLALRNNHRYYAAFWYFMAAVLALFYGVYRFQSRRSQAA